MARKMDQPNHSSSYTQRKVSGIKLDLVCIWPFGVKLIICVVKKNFLKKSVTNI